MGVAIADGLYTSIRNMRGCIKIRIADREVNNVDALPQHLIELIEGSEGAAQSAQRPHSPRYPHLVSILNNAYNVLLIPQS